MTRTAFIEAIRFEISDKIKRIQHDIEMVQHALGEETKSSAGDKYETSREMMQQEMNKLGQQLIEQKKFLHQVTEIEPITEQQVSSGNLVETSNGIFLVGIPFGKLILTQLELQPIMGISLAAPLTAKMIGKTKNDWIDFNGQKLNIKLVF